MEMQVSLHVCVLDYAIIHAFIYTVHCGYPQAPRGGHLVDNITTEEGSEVLYKCDEGLTPQGIMTALCTEEGLWRPNPAAHIYTNQSMIFSRLTITDCC